MRLLFISIISVLFVGFCTNSMALNKEYSVFSPDENSEITAYVDSLSQKCWELRGVHPDSAVEFGLQAIELIEAHELNTKLGKVTNYVGVVYMHYLYKYKEAIPYFQKAMRTSLLLKDSLQLAYSYNNLGDVYLLGGNIPLALQYGEASLDIFTKLKNDRGMAYGYINLAEAYRARKEYEKSLELFEKATTIRSNQYTDDNSGFVLFNEAKTFEQSGNLKEAMLFYQRSLNLSYNSSDLRYVSWCLSGIADIYYAQANYRLAYEYYQKALEWDKERNYEYGIVTSYIGLALIYAHTNAPEKGEPLLNEALALASKLEINTLIIKSYNSFFEFYKILGDFENVTRSFEVFLTQYDSILSAQQFEIINELEQNFAIHQDLLQAEQELNSVKFRRFRLIVIVLLMAAVIVVLTLVYRSNKKMNKELEETNRTKDRLFSVISHDLRNPFNSLIGFSEELKDELEQKDYESAIQYASYLNRSAKEGYGMLNNLLDWSMSQSGRIQFTPTLFDFELFLEDLKKYFISQNEKYNVSLNFENTIFRKVSADANILRIILTNLVTNAFKYTPEGGTITVNSICKNEELIITVKDSGIGMSEAAASRLFDKTSDIESERGIRNEKGIGLGLRIVRELTQSHKGTITVSSQLKKGTTFELRVPVNV